MPPSRIMNAAAAREPIPPPTKYAFLVVVMLNLYAQLIADLEERAENASRRIVASVR
jgi:hypothetical protein